MSASSRLANGLDRAAGYAFLLWVATTATAIAPMSIAGGACVALTLAAWLARGGVRWPHTPVDWPALGWLAALLVASLAGENPLASLPRLTKGLLPFVAGLAAWHARGERDGARAVAVLLGTTALVSVIGVAGWAVGGADLASRARGLAGHYMTFAGELTLGVALAAGIAVAAPQRRWRALAIVAVIVGVAALAATFTRSAWIAIVVAFAVVLALRAPRGLLALGVVVALAIAFAPGAFRERIFSAIDPQHPWNRERVLMWQAGLRMFADHPLTGIGLQDLHVAYERYRSPLAIERVGHLHNVFVQIAATMGALGLAAFVWLYSTLLAMCAPWRGGRVAASSRSLGHAVRLGAFAALVGFLVAGCFEWNFGDEELLHRLYLIVGLAWASRGWRA